MSIVLLSLVFFFTYFSPPPTYTHIQILEARFTFENFSNILSIPVSKTLLRRHLASHFNNLVGERYVGEKNQAETAVNYVPLTLNSKIKVDFFTLYFLCVSIPLVLSQLKRGIFSSRRSKSEAECENFVCPIESDQVNGEDSQV